MSLTYTFRPLQWAGPVTPTGSRRSRYTFRAGWTDSLTLLEHELDHLDARRVVVEADFREGDLRIDGMPRANARQPEFPGVRLAFDSRHGSLAYATDAYEFWQHNVRAIALSLEALRAVDRYGVTKRAEQYTGWKAIGSGPGTPMPSGSMSTDEAAAFLRDQSSLPPSAELRAHYRLLALRWHPDRDSGDPAKFLRLQQAKEVLGL